MCEAGVDLGPKRTVCPDKFRKSMIYVGVALLFLIFIALRVKERARSELEKRKLGKQDSESYPGFDHEKMH